MYDTPAAAESTRSASSSALLRQINSPAGALHVTASDRRKPSSETGDVTAVSTHCADGDMKPHFCASAGPSALAIEADPLIPPAQLNGPSAWGLDVDKDAFVAAVITHSVRASERYARALELLEALPQIQLVHDFHLHALVFEGRLCGMVDYKAWIEGRTSSLDERLKTLEHLGQEVSSSTALDKIDSVDHMVDVVKS